MTNDTLTFEKLNSYTNSLINAKPVIGDDLIRKMVMSCPVHPRDVAAAEEMYDYIFGKRWRML